MNKLAKSLFCMMVLVGFTASAAPKTAVKPVAPAAPVSTKIDDLEADDLEPLPENQNEGHISASELDAEFMSELEKPADQNKKRE